MAQAKTLNVNRDKLIETLEARVASSREAREANVRREFTVEQQRRERAVSDAQASLNVLLRTPNDVSAMARALGYSYRNFDERTDLERDIELLKMSDQETISVGPMSNFYKYL